MPNTINGSNTPGVVPQAGTLVSTQDSAELFVNTADGKLFFEDALGTVRLLADVRVADLANGSATITAGSVDGTPIGASNASTGVFTTLRAGSMVLPAVSGLLKSGGPAGVTRAIAGVDYVSPITLGAPLGAATLDANGRLLASQLPTAVTSGLQYLGTWDANTNTPNLQSGVGVPGTFYRVAVSGTTMLDDQTIWHVGDDAIFNGATWARVAGSTAPVVSVNGLVGAVTITRAGLQAAKSGVNSDITELTGLATPVSVAQGGTGKASLVGILKGKGSSIDTAVPGTDYAVPPDGSPGQLLANRGSGGFANITLGGGLSLTSGVLSADIPSVVAVRSVDINGGGTGLTFNGGPIVDTGSFTVGGVLAITAGGTGATTRQEAMNALAGSTTNRTFLRGNGYNVTMASIQPSDVPVLNQNTTGSASIVTNPSQPNITALGNLSSLTVSGQTYLGSELIVSSSAGTAGYVLTSQGPGNAPIWKTLPVPQEASNVGTVTSVDVSGGTTGLTFSGGPITSSGRVTMGGVLDVIHGGTGTTEFTGSGANVLQIAPTIKGPSISDGQIDNTIIGGAVPAAATFTNVTATDVSLRSLVVSSDVTFNGNAAAKLPVGSTAQRPLPTKGSVRFNSDLNIYEGARNGAWYPIGSSDADNTFKKVSSAYTALPNDSLAVDTSLVDFVIALPASPANGTQVQIVDISDFSLKPLQLNGNGRAFYSTGTELLEVSTKGASLKLVFNGSVWRVFGNAEYAWSAPSGNGSPVLATSPKLVTPDLGTPSALNLANAHNLAIDTGTTGVLPISRGGTGSISLSSGMVRSNGTSLVPATAGVDYAPPVTVPYGSLLSGDNAGGVTGVTIGAGLSLVGGVLSAALTGGGAGAIRELSGGSTGLAFYDADGSATGVPALKGVLSVANGGTGQAYLGSGLIRSTGTGPLSVAVPGVDFAPPTTGTSDELLANNGNGGYYNVVLGPGLFLSNGILDATGGHGSVTQVDVSGGTTGLTFSGGPVTSAGILTLGGTLGVANGGTGRANLGTGILKGAGTANVVTAVAGVDYAAPTSATASQLLAGDGNGGFTAINVGTGLALVGTTLEFATPGGSSTVDSFNGRAGAVVPKVGDYDASLIEVMPTVRNPGTLLSEHLTNLNSDNGAKYVGVMAASPNAVPQTVADKLQHLVSVTDFIGCDPTGVEDSLPAFQAAYDHVASGSELLVPAGAYQLSASVVKTPGKRVTWNMLGTIQGGDLPEGSLAKYEGGSSSTLNYLDLLGTPATGTRNEVYAGAVVQSNLTGVSTKVGVQSVSLGSEVAAQTSMTEVSAVGYMTVQVGLATPGSFVGTYVTASNLAPGISAVGMQVTSDSSVQLDVGYQVSNSKVGILVTGAAKVGLDLSTGTYSDAAVKLSTGSTLSFTSDGIHGMEYGYGGIARVNGSSVTHILQDNGDLFLSGTLSVTGAAVASNAGAPSGEYLTIMVNGALYKIALLANQ